MPTCSIRRWRRSSWSCFVYNFDLHSYRGRGIMQYPHLRMVVSIHNYQVYRLIFLAGVPSILVHDIVWLMIILSTQGNTTYTPQITLICFSGPPRALMFCFYCCAACDKLETNNKNAGLFYMLYIVYTFMFYVCVYCTFAITKHARHAKYSVYTYVHSFFIYVCI